MHSAVVVAVLVPSLDQHQQMGECDTFEDMCTPRNNESALYMDILHAWDAWHTLDFYLELEWQSTIPLPEIIIGKSHTVVY